MMKRTVYAMMLMMLLAATTMAAPSLLVTKPPVQPNPPDAPTGPNQDPYAVQGQWCEDGVRTHEFYDNRPGDGGSSPSGGIPGSVKTIYGKVTQITWGEHGMTGFTITATISNPNTDPNGAWRSGWNDHYPEGLNTDEYYKGTLYDTVLTASFAVRQGDPSGFMLPSSFVVPYTNRTPYIYATNEDMGAWYCWNPDIGPNPDGDYFVPTWDFGDIALGQSATRDLTFGVAGDGLQMEDPRYNAILTSSNAGPTLGDILLNRTTSLKMSDWIEDVCIDEGIAYPTDTIPVPDPCGRILNDPDRNSDISVFHNVPEPVTMSLLAVGAIGLIRRRRK